MRKMVFVINIVFVISARAADTDIDADKWKDKIPYFIAYQCKNIGMTQKLMKSFGDRVDSPRHESMSDSSSPRVRFIRGDVDKNSPRESCSSSSSPRIESIKKDTENTSPKSGNGPSSPRRRILIEEQKADHSFCLTVMRQWAKEKSAFFKDPTALNQFYVNPIGFVNKVTNIPIILQPIISCEILKRNDDANLYRLAINKLSNGEVDIDRSNRLFDTLSIEQALFIFYALRNFHYTFYIPPEGVKVFDEYAEEYEKDLSFIQKKQWQSQRDNEFKKIRKSLPEPLDKLLKEKIDYAGYIHG